MEVIDKIKKVMEQREISQYRLALDAGIPHSSLSALLKGETKNPSMEMISKIGDALHVTTDYLLGKTDVNLYDWMPISGENQPLQEAETSKNPPASSDVKDFIDKIELEDLVDQVSITVDGQELSRNDLLKIIELVRLDRRFE